MTAPRDDIDRLMAVMDAAFDPHWGEAWTRRQIEDALLMGNCHYLLVNPQGLPCSTDDAAAGFSLTRHIAGEEELLLFAVMPQHRCKGIGSRLLELAFAEARGRDAQRMFLEMRANNPAESLYLACGFRPIGQRPAYYRTSTGERLDAKTLCLDLQANGL